MLKLKHLNKRQALTLVVDACIVINAYTLACMALFSHQAKFNYAYPLLFFLPLAVTVHLGINLRLGLYRSIGRYVGLAQGVKLTRAALIAVPLLLVVGWVTMPTAFVYALALVPIGALLTFIMMSGVRFYPRFFYERSLREARRKLRLLIVGAGAAGEMMVRNIQKEPQSDMNAVAFVDDNPELCGMEIHGLPIYSPCTSIPQVVADANIDEIAIAIPSAPLKDFQRIFRICHSTGRPVKTIRPLQSTQLGKVGLHNLREIRIEDTLGRQPVHTDYVQIREVIEGKSVMITGAGGSIGSELSLQISQHNPTRVTLVDQDESALYRIHQKLVQLCLQNHEMVVADIKSERKMASLLGSRHPDLVFHAAAYKHVPLMELHADEAILNNVHGTANVARLAGENGAQSFINISTDKAVDPVNVMGATKYLGERLLDELRPQYPNTLYRSVRFGNVLGSRGSVIPIFRQQILDGGPVTVTHPEMTRYFMLISEAVDLVLQAASFQGSNNIYVLDMGEPVRIVDLAQQMIDLTKPAQPVEMAFIGLRPGEKLHETLFHAGEVSRPSSHPMILEVARPHEEMSIMPEIETLIEAATAGDCGHVKTLLSRAIPSYTPFDMAMLGSTKPTPDNTAGYSSHDPDADTAVGFSYNWSVPDDIADSAGAGGS